MYFRLKYKYKFDIAPRLAKRITKKSECLKIFIFVVEKNIFGKITKNANKLQLPDVENRVSRNGVRQRGQLQSKMLTFNKI